MESARSWSVLLLVLLVACHSERPEDDFVLGPDADTSGNSFGHSVSKAFDEREMRQLHAYLNSAVAIRELEKLNCDRRLLPHEFSVVLWREGKYRERQVRLQMTPRLYTADPCLNDAISHLFGKTVEAADKGAPIDYGYKDPLTGKPLDTSKWANYVSPAPKCPCQESSSASPDPDVGPPSPNATLQPTPTRAP